MKRIEELKERLHKESQEKIKVMDKNIDYDLQIREIEKEQANLQEQIKEKTYNIMTIQKNVVVLNILEEIKRKNEIDKNIYGYFQDISYNLDLENDYLFISLESEDLKEININNIENYEDVTIIDLTLDYDLYILELVQEYLENILKEMEK